MREEDHLSWLIEWRSYEEEYYYYDGEMWIFGNGRHRRGRCKKTNISKSTAPRVIKLNEGLDYMYTKAQKFLAPAV